ncbi:AP-4 complex accessory subunit Tepsin-like isoform X2 [Sycon ciliatum]|uniref:AP-4 complex accessory subunit Tepsin-like isoform X2 n=1 Tax=Sycon ciliatum TaxID=27933 RepID=UPI0031F613B7
MAANLLSRVSNISQLPLLYKATGNDESLVPATTLTEIKKLTFDSSNSQQHVQDFLLEKLGSSGCYSRAKCLRILKYLVDHGPLEFTIALRRKAEPIERCKVFTGPVDPLHGDALYVGVRKQAMELLEVLYDDNLDAQRRMNTAPPAYSTGGSAGGYGSESTSSSSSSGMMGIAGPSQPHQSYAMQQSSSSSASSSATNQYNADGSKKMWGFGNTPMQQEESSILDTIKTKAVGVVDTLQQQWYKGSNPPASGSLLSSGAGSYVSAPASSYTSGRYDTGTSHEAEYSSERAVGRPGGGWDTSTPPPVAQPVSSSHYQPGGVIADPVSTPSRGASTPSAASSSQTTDNGGAATTSTAGASSSSSNTQAAEERLVGEFTTVTGVRAAPSRDQVQQFVQRCKRRDMAVVVELLLATLNPATSSSQVQIRSMCLLEELYRCDVGGASEIVSGTSGPVLQQLLQASQGPVHSKASKLLRQVNPMAATAPSSTPASQPASVPAPASTVTAETSAFADILNLSTPASDVTSTQVPQTGSAGASSAQQNSGAMFAGMSMGGTLQTQPPPPQQAAVPLNQTSSPSVMATGAADPGVSLMAGLTLSSNQTTASASSSMLTGNNMSAVPTRTPVYASAGGDLISGQEVDLFDPLKGLTAGASQPTALPATMASSQDLMFSPAAAAATTTPNMMQPLQQQQQQPGGMMRNTGMMAPGQTTPGQGTMAAGMHMHRPQQQQLQAGMMQSTAGGAGGVGMMRPMTMSSPINPAAAAAAPAQPQGVYMGPTGRTQVQLAKTGDADAGFSFLGKNTKAGAFDFVQDAMKAEKKV